MIKEILDEIANESSTNGKMEILKKHKGNVLLEKVLYLANSRRVKFYIRQIPNYETTEGIQYFGLIDSLEQLKKLTDKVHTGNEAVEFLRKILKGSSKNDAIVIERIIQKDLRIGMAKQNINKVIPKLIEETPYMGAKSFKPELVKKIFEKGGWGYSDVKMDGRYNNAIIRDGVVENESRGGEPVILDGALFLEELKLFPNCVLNGELTMDDVPRYLSNGIIMSLIDIHKKQENRDEDEHNKKVKQFEDKNKMTVQEAMNKVVFTVWDTITEDEYVNHKSKFNYEVRWETLLAMFAYVQPKMVRLVEKKIVKTYEEALNHFQECLNRGEEGTIVKSSKCLWKNGKPNEQVKMKLEMDIDLRIIGFNYGNGKNTNVISSLNCESECSTLKTSPGGINEQMMKFITENQEELMGKIVHIKGSGVSRDSVGNYSILHPRFQEIRDDKFKADTLEEILDNEQMCKGLK